jgi:shikimate kinase
MIISITGFMGCGKSSIGRKLSKLLCCPFMDLDEMIEDEAGKSIPEIFAEVGESGFRKMEHRILSSVLSVKTEEGTTSKIPEIISLGGGTVMTRECAEIVRERTLCVYLRASIQTLAEHLEGETQGRPMLSGNVQERITELMAQRAATYESTAHVIIDIDGKSVDEVTEAVIDSLSRL